MYPDDESFFIQYPNGFTDETLGCHPALPGCNTSFSRCWQYRSTGSIVAAITVASLYLKRAAYPVGSERFCFVQRIWISLMFTGFCTIDIGEGQSPSTVP
jgi:hypothetical protein